MCARMVHHAPAVEANQLSLFNITGGKKTIPLVSAGVHVLYVCASNLLETYTNIKILVNLSEVWTQNPFSLALTLYSQ